MNVSRQVGAADLVSARDQALAFLTPLAGRDWSAPAPDLEWDCESTLRHMITAQTFYSAHLATRSPRRLEVSRGVDTGLSIQALLDILFAQVSDRRWFEPAMRSRRCRRSPRRSPTDGCPSTRFGRSHVSLFPLTSRSGSMWR